MNELKVGDKVVHPVFGIGEVVRVGDVIDVKFEMLETLRSIRRDYDGLRRVDDAGSERAEQG